MRHFLHFLLLQAWAFNIHAQEVVALYSNKDVVIGYHYMLNSENTNYNYADWFGALSQPGTLGGENHSRSLIYFDLSALPVGTVVDEALLDLYGVGAVGLGAAASVGNMGANSCWLEQITEPWDETTVTWNTRPATTSMNAMLVPASSMVVQDYIGLDVTGLVQAMINHPDTAHGFAIRTVVENPTRGLFFCGAGYSDPSKRPRLRIKFSSAVGVANHSPQQTPIAYPNPVRVGTPFQFALPTNGIADKLFIFNSDGRMVYATSVTSRATNLLVDEVLLPGVYRVLIKDPKGIILRSSSMIVISG